MIGSENKKIFDFLNERKRNLDANIVSLKKILLEKKQFVICRI